MADMVRTLSTATVPELAITSIDVSSLDDDGALNAWLDEHDANFVLLRPDFYVFGTAENADSLGTLFHSLQSCLISTAPQSLTSAGH